MLPTKQGNLGAIAVRVQAEQQSKQTRMIVQWITAREGRMTGPKGARTTFWNSDVLSATVSSSLQACSAKRPESVKKNSTTIELVLDWFVGQLWLTPFSSASTS